MTDEDAGGVAGAGRPGGEVYDWFVRGRTLLESGNPEAAAELLMHAREQEPASPSVLETLARALYDARRYGEAEQRFTELVEASPGDDYARFGLGLSRMRLGDLSGAVQQLAMAAAMRPARADYQQALREVRATVRARAEAGLDQDRVTPAELAAARPAADEPDVRPGPPPPLVGGSDRPLAAVHDVALLDLDGVLYVGPDAVPGAPEALAAAARSGLRAAYVTNNAARTPEVVARHLRELGIPADPQDVVTSAQAAARLVAERVPAGAAVLVVGGEGLRTALVERGLRPVAELADDVAAVVQGFAPEVGWRQLAEATYAVTAGLPWIACNLDSTVPTARGTAPGNGSLVSVVAGAAGRRPDAVAGKPETPLHRESVERTAARRPLVVGDRLDTDIDGANRADTPSLLVLTGVSGAVDLLAAEPGLRPTYLAADLAGGLLEPHPTVSREGDGWRCGDAVVTVTGTEVSVSGAGDRVDALRALCVAWWAAGVADADEQDLRAAAGAVGW